MVSAYICSLVKLLISVLSVKSLLRLSHVLLLSSIIQRKSFIWDTPSNPVYFRVRSLNGHMSFKQETSIYLVNSSF